ncbi:MAG: hypothetical protein NZ809_05275 [Thermodesulfovibrio sp.]|nr:hypothetical protein [Thermodesulfovibrio sp.]
MKLFISGWAGFKEALGDIPEEWYFINPFIDFNEKGILDFLENKSGEIVVGWSTGGHIILKNLGFFSERFKEMIIIAGFKKFTNYIDSKLIKKMIQKIKTDPEIVLKNFLINAGCSQCFPQQINYQKLIDGLEFLIFSEVINTNHKVDNLVFIQGLYDKILPIKALEDLKDTYPFAKTYVVKKPHWIGFEEIKKIKASGSS